MNKHTITALVFLMATGPSLAGTWSLITDPTYVSDSSNIRYIPINKTKANSDGVTFTLTATPVHGTISDWHWDLINGTPPESSSESPTITFGSSAYGHSNQCTAKFDHFGSGGSGKLCSSPSIISYVNVLKPYLGFHLSGFSTDDSLATSSYVSGLAFATSGPTFNQGQSFTNYGTARGGTPYEYKITANPSNSGGISSDFSILEKPTRTIVVYSGATAVQTITITPIPDQHYNPGDSNVATLDQGTTPTNPVLYAFDAPNLPESEATTYMQAYSGDRVVVTTTLTSTPCYQVDTNPADTTLQESNTFVLTGRTDGAGHVNWSND